MVINSFTLIDAFNQFWKVCGDGDRRSLTSAGLTYYYLCNVWNTCSRPVSFRRQNNLICSELEISKPTLERHRNTLKQAGLIDFFSKGKGDPNITYRILDVYGGIGGAKTKSVLPPSQPAGSNKNLLPEVKKANNITTDVTTHVTSDDDIKQSTEEDLFIVISGEVKNFYYLKDLFSADSGLVILWKGKGYPMEEFPEGIKIWMARNHNTPYHDFSKARNHFLNWMPSYSFQKEETNGTKTHQGAAGKAEHDSPGNSNYAGGF